MRSTQRFHDVLSQGFCRRNRITFYNVRVKFNTPSKHPAFDWGTLIQHAGTVGSICPNCMNHDVTIVHLIHGCLEGCNYTFGFSLLIHGCS